MIQAEIFSKWFENLFAETFGVSGTPHGYFLDSGTSGLLPVLKALTAERASAQLAPGRSSIAAHAFHLLFSLRLFDEDEHRVTRDSPVDWASSWSTQRVDAAAWQHMQAELQLVYLTIVTRIHGSDDWPELRVADALMQLAHTAYHVGEIRQMIGLLEACAAFAAQGAKP